MRRTLIALASALVVLAATLTTVFAFSEFRTRSARPLPEALADFAFALDTGVRHLFGIPFPALEDGSYGRVMARARSGAHSAVREGIELRLLRWGAPVLPRLARELERSDAAAAARDLSRIYTTLAGIGGIGGPEAAQILVDWLGADGRLERIADPRAGGGLLARAVSALGRVRDPAATGLLIEIHRRRLAEPSAVPVLDAIGRSRTPNAVAYLLERHAAARDEAEIDALVWPLAFTHDPRAAAILGRLRVDSSERLRSAAFSGMQQERGPHLLDAYLALLEQPLGDAIHAEALDGIVHAESRGDARALAAATQRIGHPFLDRYARSALFAVLDEASLARQQGSLAFLGARDMVVALRQLGAVALPLVEAFVDSPARASERAMVVRQIAIQKVLEGRGLLTRLASDLDPEIRAAARWSLSRLDKMALLRGLLDRLPEEIAQVAWREIRGGTDEDAILSGSGYGDGFAAVWGVLTAVHAASTLLAAGLGILLVCNAIRVFQPYRFNLFIQFLLLEGFVGDFFLMDFGPRPEWTYLAATSAHLLLAIGMLCKEQERLPGAERSRFERLGGASLWLLVPALLAFGAPPLAQALRTAAADLSTFAPFLVLTALLGLLVLEQAVVPASLFFRSARAERVLTFSLSLAICALLASAMLRSAALREAAGEPDARALAWLLLAPLAALLVRHAASLGLLVRGERPFALGTAPSRRMRVIQDGETLTVWLAPRRRAAARALALAADGAFVLATAGVAGWAAGRGGDLAAILVGLVAALAGAVLAALLLQALRACVLVQIRDGHARCADTVLGGVFGRAPWSRRIVFPARVRRWLARQRSDTCPGGAAPPEPLEPAELAWLEAALAWGERPALARVRLEPRA